MFTTQDGNVVGSRASTVTTQHATRQVQPGELQGLQKVWRTPDAPATASQNSIQVRYNESLVSMKSTEPQLALTPNFTCKL